MKYNVKFELENTFYYEKHDRENAAKEPTEEDVLSGIEKHSSKVVQTVDLMSDAADVANNVISWNIVHDADDDGKPTTWSAQVDSDEFGKYVWIEKFDNGYDVVINNDNDDMVVIKSFDFLYEAQEFVEEAISEERENDPKKTTTADKGGNFTITDDILGQGGAKSKFKANVKAIRTLKTLESENRPATAEEQKIMSLYVGWGGLANAFDDSKSDWTNEYAQLKELLTREEYESARSSVLNSFYTPPFIIDSIYKALENMGFDGGNILEPSLGVGNFLGKIPVDIFKDTLI